MRKQKQTPLNFSSLSVIKQTAIAMRSKNSAFEFSLDEDWGVNGAVPPKGQFPFPYLEGRERVLRALSISTNDRLATVKIGISSTSSSKSGVSYKPPTQACLYLSISFSIAAVYFRIRFTESSQSCTEDRYLVSFHGVIVFQQLKRCHFCFYHCCWPFHLVFL